MARRTTPFRIIERQHIILRRAEANACLHYLLYHSATLTACSGIELLMEFLVSKLYEELKHGSQRKANSLLNEVKNEEDRNEKTIAYWGLRSWAEFYKRNNIFDRLSQKFNYKFQVLNEHALKTANDIWNKCKHDSYSATRENADKTVQMLNTFLKEAGIEADQVVNQQFSVAQMRTHWLGEWEKPLAEWIHSNQDTPQTNILMHLRSLLDLIVALIDDSQIEFEYRMPLMVAANYVFSSLDLIPETNIKGDLRGLVDDGAVLALTLYWLLHQDKFNNSTLFSHWSGGESIVDEIHNLKNLIWEQQAVLFPDTKGQLGYKLVWKVIERIAADGPEALWQNYWQEQFRSEAHKPRI